MNIGDLVIYHYRNTPTKGSMHEQRIEQLKDKQVMAIIIDKKRNEVLWEFGLSWSYTVHCADGKTYKGVSRNRLTKIEEVC
jgi:hypothetical protein